MEMKWRDALLELDSVFLNVPKCAEVIGISQYACREAIRRGLIPSVRFGPGEARRNHRAPHC